MSIQDLLFVLPTICHFGFLIFLTQLENESVKYVKSRRTETQYYNPYGAIELKYILLN